MATNFNQSIIEQGLEGEYVIFLQEVSKCQHERVTEHITHFYPSTMEDPSETVGYVVCDDCGENLGELGSNPDDSTINTVYDNDEGPDEPDIELPDFPEI
jgi:hypothetical protein